MGVSIFPSASSGSGGGFSNFAIDLGDYTDNTTTLSQSYPAGGYSIGSDPSDTTLDFYLLDADGALVGYSGTAAITATEAFTTVIVLGGQANLKLSFTFNGEAGVPDSAGNSINAGAYITSTSPADLPDINDTTTVTGGNFATDVEMNFVSGEITLAAKSITRASSVELVIGRPDALDAALDPWSMQVSNPGVPVPSGSNVNKIEVTAGATPVWVTTSPLTAGVFGDAYTTTLEATDADPDSAITYSIASGSFPGLSLDSATGVLSGTPSGAGSGTVRATDAGGNSNDRDFVLPVQLATGGTITFGGGYVIHTFESSGTFEVLATIPSLQYTVVAGGGAGGGGYGNAPGAGGGGGGGGYRTSYTGDTSGGGASAETPLSSLAVASYTMTVGGGGVANTNYGGSGSASSFGNLVNSSRGGGGGTSQTYGASNGGSGGGKPTSGNQSISGGTGTADQGFDGYLPNTNSGSTYGGGGGAGSAGIDGNARTNAGGAGVTSSATGGNLVSKGGNVQPGNSGASGSSPSAGYGHGGTAGAGGGGNTRYSGSDGRAGLIVVRY